MFACGNEGLYNRESGGALVPAPPLTDLSGICVAGASVLPAARSGIGAAAHHSIRQMNIYALLKSRAEQAPLSTALLGISRAPLSYSALLLQVEDTAKELRRRGINRGDRVALIMPNGPESAVACFAIAAAAACAPLNPAYTVAEFEFYFSDLKPKAVVLPPDFAHPAITAARNLGVPVIHLRTDPAQPAGSFYFEENFAPEPLLPYFPPGNVEFAGPDDIALVLHTSGSTARPKIVPLTHANLCASCHNIAASLSLQPADRCLNIMPLFHIHGLIGAVLSSWSAAASVAAMPAFQAPQFFDWLKEFQATWYTAVPSMHQSILTRARQLPSARGTSLRFARSCSSALAPKLMAEVEDALGVPLVEAYGMTEAAHQMSTNPLPPAARKPGSVGLAAGCGIAIMDSGGNLLGPQEVGEVVIRGESVTAGYEDNPGANQASFTSGWFRTGDQGRLDEDGYLFLTGRLKEIINRGGEKIAPREIDEVLLAHPGIAQAMTFSIPDERLGEEIGAAIVLREEALREGVLQERPRPTEIEIREFAAARLADFKVPRRIVFLSELPKGPTGKPQRIGLAAKLGLSEPSPVQPGRGFAPPVNDTETRQASIWSEVLNVTPIGIDDDFFALGGDSILGARLIARTRNEFGVDLPMHRLFSEPTVRAVSQWIDRAGRPKLAVHIPLVPREPNLPTSFAQERLWFLTQMEEQSAAYTASAAVRIRGPLQMAALEQSFRAIVARHEVLRTTFSSVNGDLRQRVEPEYPIELPFTDLTSLAQHRREDRARELARRETHRYFDLSRDFPVRGALLRLDREDHVLILTLHHIASDGWSKAIFFRELEAFYRRFADGSSAASSESWTPPPELAVQYADFASWRRKQLERNAGELLEAYWARQLAGLPERVDLPTDRPRPARQTFAGAIERAVLPHGLAGQLRSLSRTESTTLFMTLLAAFQTLLRRYSGQTDICVGTPVALRDRPETEVLIGPFINTLPLRGDLSGDPTFRELLSRVREMAVGAYDHQSLPLERIIEIVHPKRSLRHPPLFQVLFQLNNFPEVSARLAGLDVAAFDFDPGAAAFDLTLSLTDTQSQLECVLNFNTALFDAPTAQRMLGHYQTLLEGIVTNPDARISALPLMSQEELQKTLALGLVKKQVIQPEGVTEPRPSASGVEWNRPLQTHSANRCIHHVFEERAAVCPDAVAVVFGNRSLNYRQLNYCELNKRANQLAHELRVAGVCPETLVAICMDRSIEMMVAILGVLKAGGAYVPMDPAYPAERLAFMLADAQVRVLITQSGLVEELPSHEAVEICLDSDWPRIADRPTDNPASQVSAKNAAYVIYTSGSTGKPKGVVVTHANVTRLFSSTEHWFKFGPNDTWTLFHSPAFDFSVWEIWGALFYGGRLIVVPQAVVRSPEAFHELLVREGVTVLNQTPSAFRNLILADERSRDSARLALRLVIFGGEALEFKTLLPWVRRHGDRPELVNMYGITETTVHVTYFKIPREAIENDSGSLVGTPIPDLELYVLDGKRQPAPIGVPGELYVGGAGVARGYLNRPELTDGKFVPNPFCRFSAVGSLLYKTGDLVRYRPDGNIEFLGRIDNQVKIRGFRIEVGEIENALREHPDVSAAAVTVIEDGPLDKRLVAHFVPSNHRVPEEAVLRQFLKQKLPAYMVPSRVCPLEALPLTLNGKIDRSALSTPLANDRPVPGPEPRGVVEVLLLQIWEDVLGRRPIGLDDDFFDLGGHSLLGMRLLAGVERAFSKRLTLVNFFEAPTVRKMAELLKSSGSTAAHSRLIPISSSGSGSPLFLIGPQPLFRPLILRLAENHPVIGFLQPEAAAFEPPFRMESIAQRYIRMLREYQPHGPYSLAGWCVDGVLAFEMAQQLRAAGEEVPVVILIDSFNRTRSQSGSRWAACWDRLKFHARNLAHLDLSEKSVYLGDRLDTARQHTKSALWRLFYQLHVWTDRRLNDQLRSFDRILSAANRDYLPLPYDGKIVLMRASVRPPGTDADAAYGWRHIIPNLKVVDVPANHRDIFIEPNVEAMASAFSAALSAATVTELVVPASLPTAFDHPSMVLNA